MSFLKHLLNKTDQTESAVLETSHFLLCTLSVNKIETVMYLSPVVCQFLLTCFVVSFCKISDKTEKSLLNYSNCIG